MYNFTLLRLKYKSCAKYVEPPVRSLVYKDVAWNRNSHYWKGGQALGGRGRGGLYIFIGYVYLNEIFFLKLFGKLNGKNKTINITNKKKGKERIVEEVVTGSGRSLVRTQGTGAGID